MAALGKFTPEEEEDIVREYNDGSSIAQLKVRYLCNPRRVKRVLVKHGIKIRCLPFTQERLREFAQLYREGLSSNQMGKRFDCKGTSVMTALRREGIEPRRRGEHQVLSIPSSQLQEMAELYKETGSIRLVARRFSIDSKTVKRHLFEAYPTLKDVETTRYYKQIWEHELSSTEVAAKVKRTSAKISEGVQGEKCNFWGKPPPHSGGGYGVKGWYKEFFFRSLKELSFILSQEENHKIVSAEKIIRVPYTFGGVRRNYFPDFIIDNEIVIELKDKASFGDPKVVAKLEALDRYCKRTGYTWKLEDCRVAHEAIACLYHKRAVQFLASFEQYAIERYGKIAA